MLRSPDKTTVEALSDQRIRVTYNRGGAQGVTFVLDEIQSCSAHVDDCNPSRVWFVDKNNKSGVFILYSPEPISPGN